ncbi:hypothetical protein D3C80_2228250 [compost metagenome]
MFVENPHIEKIYGSNFSDDHKQAVNSQMVEKGTFYCLLVVVVVVKVTRSR